MARTDTPTKCCVCGEPARHKVIHDDLETFHYCDDHDETERLEASTRGHGSLRLATTAEVLAAVDQFATVYSGGDDSFAGMVLRILLAWETQGRPS